jgi:hypothetical protein
MDEQVFGARLYTSVAVSRSTRAPRVAPDHWAASYSAASYSAASYSAASYSAASYSAASFSMMSSDTE